MTRFQVLSDEQWEAIVGLLPAPTGRRGRPFSDARSMVEGIVGVRAVADDLDLASPIGR